ncbi:MAG: hypothetical protein IIB77_05005 [Proteobacteria bacterium]|nr:hypothetical protein [Pseudomonadota bacterium]
MKIDKFSNLEKVDPEFSNIQLVEPSSNYATKGHEIILDVQSSPPISVWRFFSVYNVAIVATLVTAIGITIGFRGPDKDTLEDFEILNFVTDNDRKTTAHQLISSSDFQIIQTGPDQKTEVISQESIVEGLLIVNCQDCHESEFLKNLIPESAKMSPAEISRLTKQNIIELLATTKS